MLKARSRALKEKTEKAQQMEQSRKEVIQRQAELLAAAKQDLQEAQTEKTLRAYDYKKELDVLKSER